MKYAIDETELARLLDLYNKAESEPWNPLDDQDYIEAACNAVPALVAEVRRLREDRTAMLRDMDAVKTKAEPCDDCWTIYMLMREMGIEEKNWFHRDVCARLKAMQNAEEENAALREKVEAWRDAAELEATVASKLTRLDAEDLPCANSMMMFCPRPPFRGRNCGSWCLMRMARLEAEEEMEKHADRE